MKLKDLIAECTAYDFKVMLEEKKPKSWLKSVSAFANGLGGSLFFGIDNDGIIKGLDDVTVGFEGSGNEWVRYKNRQKNTSDNPKGGVRCVFAARLNSNEKPSRKEQYKEYCENNQRILILIF